MSDSESDKAFGGISEDFVQSPEHKTSTITSVHFDGLLSTPLRLHENLAKGCGGQVWPAGVVLSKYMLRTHNDLSDRTILELGAGGGLVGLAVALGCRTSRAIHLTDQTAMLDLMRDNIKLNDLDQRAHASVYDWGEPTPSDLPQHPDIILAADCVYFEPAFPLLQRTMLDLIGPQTVCYFCFKKRRRADLHFVRAAKKTFVMREVLEDPDREVYSRDNIFLYEIRRKSTTT